MGGVWSAEKVLLTNKPITTYHVCASQRSAWVLASTMDQENEVGEVLSSTLYVMYDILSKVINQWPYLSIPGYSMGLHGPLLAW